MKLRLFIVCLFFSLAASFFNGANINAAGNFSCKSCSPSNNSRNVQPDLKEIRLTFLYSVDWNYPDADKSIVLKDSKNNVLHFSASISDNELTLDILDVLASDTKYFVTVPAGILKSMRDEQVNAPISISFTTKDISFGHSTSTPANKERNVDLSAEYITFSFNENISVLDEELFNSIAAKDSLGNIVSYKTEISNNYLKLRVGGMLKSYTTYISEQLGAFHGKSIECSKIFYRGCTRKC